MLWLNMNLKFEHNIDMYIKPENIDQIFSFLIYIIQKEKLNSNCWEYSMAKNKSFVTLKMYMLNSNVNMSVIITILSNCIIIKLVNIISHSHYYNGTHKFVYLFVFEWV